MLGRNEMTYNHQPQQPSGTSEKNEKKEVRAVLEEFSPTALLLAILHPNLLALSDRNNCRPTPTPIPNIMGEFN
jgi:hypothetical protein